MRMQLRINSKEANASKDDTRTGTQPLEPIVQIKIGGAIILCFKSLTPALTVAVAAFVSVLLITFVPLVGSLDIDRY